MQGSGASLQGKWDFSAFLRYNSWEDQDSQTHEAFSIYEHNRINDTHCPTGNINEALKPIQLYFRKEIW